MVNVRVLHKISSRIIFWLFRTRTQVREITLKSIDQKVITMLIDYNINKLRNYLGQVYKLIKKGELWIEEIQIQNIQRMNGGLEI